MTHNKVNSMEKKNLTRVIERSMSGELRDFFNVGKVKRLFHVGAEIFVAVQPFVKKPTLWNCMHSAFAVGKVIVDDFEIWPDDFFDETWESPYPSDFTNIIHKTLLNKPYELIKTSDPTTVIHKVTFEDVEFGFSLNTKNNYVNKIYVKANKLLIAKEIIKKELWRLMKDDNVVLKNTAKKQKNGYDSEMSSIEIIADDIFQQMPSQRSNEYSAYLKKCIDAGVPRSVLLYGPPGTGKSTMARTIVSNLGMRSFRIRVEDIGNIDTATIFEAINIFEPDAVILDDFDRSSSQITLLETLEFFQKHVKLVIATVNNKNLLDEAILRPGRFDELVQIKQMDADVVKSVLGAEHEDSYDLVKDWPVAFIHEYVKRRRFMNESEAAKSTIELALRVKRLASKYDDEDPDESIDNEKLPWFETHDVIPSKPVHKNLGSDFNKFVSRLNSLHDNRVFTSSKRKK